MAGTVDEALAACLDGGAALHGLTIPAEWREAVLANMRVLAQAAALVVEHPLDDHAEAAPVFAA